MRAPEPLMGWFGPKRPLGADEWEWQLAALASDLRDAARYVARRDMVADVMAADLAAYGAVVEARA